LEPSLANTVGGAVVKSRPFGWQPVLELTWCVVLVKEHSAMQLTSYLLLQCRPDFFNQISVVGTVKVPLCSR